MRFAFAFALVGALWLSLAGPVQADTGNDALHAATCTPIDQCCKVCDAGEACGNSCISAAKTCHKGRGCACNARDVCSDSP